MKVLLIHHLETIWQAGYRMYGTTFFDVAQDILNHITGESYDRVILTRFEDPRLEDEHWESGIADFIDEIQEYGYGWDLDMVDREKEGIDWVWGGEHSEVVLLFDWIARLRGNDVHLCGAFDRECIEDMELALEGCGVNFERLEHLIIG